MFLISHFIVCLFLHTHTHINLYHSYTYTFQISMSVEMAATDVMLMPGVPTLQATIPAPAMMASLEMGLSVQQSRENQHSSALLGISHGDKDAWVCIYPTILRKI